MYLYQRLALLLGAGLIIYTAFMQEAIAASKSGGGASSFLTGSSSLGLGFIYTSVSQDDMNGIIDYANTNTSGGISTKDFSGSYEIFANWIYRFDRSSYAMVLRPSYVWQSTSGTGSGGDYNYKLYGFSIFPMFRVYPLENSFIHFFMQAGLGYGVLNGDITAASSSVSFKGSAFGAVGGIGVDFCFTDAHCVTVEGNLRYLPIERNIASGNNCTSIPGLTQCGDGQEVERNYKDLATSMSGVQGVLAYTYNF